MGTRPIYLLPHTAIHQSSLLYCSTVLGVLHVWLSIIWVETLFRLSMALFNSPSSVILYLLLLLAHISTVYSIRYPLVVYTVDLIQSVSLWRLSTQVVSLVGMGDTSNFEHPCYRLSLDRLSKSGLITPWQTKELFGACGLPWPFERSRQTIGSIVMCPNDVLILWGPFMGLSNMAGKTIAGSMLWRRKIRNI